MTLPLDVVTNIRRLHYAEHWKVGTIATELRVHHEAVERALGLDSECSPRPKRSATARVGVRGQLSAVSSKGSGMRSPASAAASATLR